MGATEIIVIFLVYLMFFGAKGIPSLARTMGRAVRSFREATSDIQREIMDNTNDVRRGAEDFKRNIGSDDSSS
ncbi:MAG: Sec-independent protein translocase subunit TatA/TatB [Flavobacteriales bacterium]